MLGPRAGDRIGFTELTNHVLMSLNFSPPRLIGIPVHTYFLDSSHKIGGGRLDAVEAMIQALQAIGLLIVQ